MEFPAVNMRCPLCGTTEAALVRTVPDDRSAVSAQHAVLCCRTCDHWFLDFDRIDQNDPRLYVDHYSSQSRKRWDRIYIALRSTIFRSPLFRYWTMWDGDQYFLGAAAAERGLRLLDFGCFEGRVLRQYLRCGYRAEGLENNPAAAETAMRTGAPVYVGDVNVLPPSARYDVIVMAGVLEHLERPIEVLTRLHDQLISGGVLRISCPNRDSVFQPVFGPHWANWHAPFHRSHYRARHVATLLERVGFTVSSVRTVSPSVDLMRSTLSALRLQADLRFPLVPWAILITATYAFLLKPLIFTINRTGHGDCLLIEARRS